MKKKTHIRHARRDGAVSQTPPAPPNWLLLCLSSLGITLTGYLVWTSFTGEPVRGCAVGQGCDLVLTSRWSTLMGLPTALWGLLAYAGLARVAFIRRADTRWSYAFTGAFFGVCYSLYLTSVSLTLLGATCPYCLTSLGLMVAILGLVIAQRPAPIAARPWRSLLVGRGVVAALVIGMLHLYYTGPAPESLGPEDPAIQALAEHLSEQDVLFYGASWCPHCQEQKRLFGASAHRLPYIECGALGPNAPAAPSCVAAGIQTYPTWVIGGRSTAAVMSLAELAAATKFSGAADLP